MGETDPNSLDIEAEFRGIVGFNDLEFLEGVEPQNTPDVTERIFAGILETSGLSFVPEVSLADSPEFYRACGRLLMEQARRPDATDADVAELTAKAQSRLDLADSIEEELPKPY